jgi:large subunit ribosomal protein L29
MYVIKAAELRNQSKIELGQTLSGLLKEQFKLRLLASGNEAGPTHQMKAVRRSIARLQTIFREHEQKSKGTHDE